MCEKSSPSDFERYQTRIAALETENTHWRTEREAMVSRELYEAAVKEQRERAEEAEQKLAAARADAVRDAFEWLAAQTPDTECSESAVWLQKHAEGSESAIEDRNFASAAHKGYLIYLARKEPTDG